MRLHISIHALREEGDTKAPALFCARTISIHALREEGDDRGDRHRSGRTISIHALREEGDPERFFFIPKQLLISIHALREEGDYLVAMEGETDSKFLSTPSARRATSRPRVPLQIAPHFYPRPPRGGRQCLSGCRCSGTCNFYPRPPRGGRRDFLEVPEGGELFLSTPSARRATRSVVIF